ncbi:MAG TPA: helix-turn-helix domain-containing protein [Actinospica sp.]|jgi:hypothetical protein|nr:helix-turn-helix domain-containing protein [Actinospica sp.]
MMTHSDDPAKPAALETGDDDILNDGFLSTEELARLIQVDPSTLRRWRSANPPIGPDFVPVSDRVTKYAKSDVRRWIDHRRVQTSAPEAEAVDL